MTKQLLIYESAVPLSASRHAQVSLEAKAEYPFSAGINAVPLMAVEILRAAGEYAIVFTAAGDDVMPAAVLGVRGDQNLYLDAAAHWQADYVPAFIRRYPFVFSASADGRTLTLCVDEAHPGLNREGRGQRLFGDDGKPSDYTQTVLKFLQHYQLHFERTRRFGARLKALGVLEPMQATVTTPSGEQLRLSNFLVVSRDRLRALPAEQIDQLARSDDFELIHLHLYSLRNFVAVKDRLIESLSKAEAAMPAPVEPEAVN